MMKKGDRILLKTLDDVWDYHPETAEDKPGIHEDMEKFFGNWVTFSHYTYGNDTGIFDIVEDEGKWIWTVKWIDAKKEDLLPKELFEI